MLHGWSLIVGNVFIYGYICWLGFWFARGTSGLERFFIVGWFAGVLFWPVKMLRPQWAGIIKHINIIGLAVSLLAAIALLLAPSEGATFDGPN
jgi:hypothetical protein